MLNELGFWSKKIKDGLDLAHNFYYKNSALFPKEIKKIVFLGMGGSGIAGRIVKTFLDKKTHIPSFIIDSPSVPEFVDAETLAIVISYSGNTWEVVDALERLAERFIPTVVLSHGGKTLEIAENKNLPFILLPSSLQPRLSLGNCLGILFGLFDLIGILDGKKILEDFIKVSDLIVPKFKDKNNFKDFLHLAKNRDFFHIWGIAADSDSFAYRTQTQFNENSKIYSVSSVFPEVSHNLLSGFEKNKEKALILILNSDFITNKVNIALKSVSEILREKGVELYKVPVFGDTWPSQLFSMILWSDFASYYLGKLRGVDVIKVEMIEGLKKRFKQNMQVAK